MFEASRPRMKCHQCVFHIAEEYALRRCDQSVGLARFFVLTLQIFLHLRGFSFF